MTAQNLRELLEGDDLTDREIDILYGLARGETAKQTGERLYLASDTVKEYRKRVVAKLGAVNLYNAIAIAIGTGVLNIERIVEIR